jgi:hypothetical protein
LPPFASQLAALCVTTAITITTTTAAATFVLVAAILARFTAA